MSVEVVSESNPGPLKLEYDNVQRSRERQMEGVLATPRDMRNPIFGEGSPTPFTNFRKKGFPEKRFEASRHPIFGTAPDDTELQGVKLSEIQGSEHRTRTQYFDTRNPRAFGNPRGLQYGSSALPENSTTAQPIRGSLMDMDRSSAEVHKFKQRQEEGAQEIRKLKQERMQAMMSAEAEKKYDMEMLKNYDPWGKPGAGAPMGGSDNKKKKFAEADVQKVRPSPRPNGDYLEEYGDNTSWWGKPGAGAPLRTNSGKVVTEIKGQQDIRFLDTQKGRNVYDVEVRYKQDPQQRYKYSKDLEKQIASKRLESQEARILDLKEELAMVSPQSVAHDPYGKPGAGAPNKTMSGNRTQYRRKMTLSNNTDEQRRIEYKTQSDGERHALAKAAQGSSEGGYDPWGKGVGHPEYDKHGDSRRHPNTRRYEGVFTDKARPAAKDELFGADFDYKGHGNTLDMSNTRGGGGAPIVDEHAEFGKQTRLPIILKRDEKGDTTFREDLPGLRRRPPPPTADDEELRIYDPFGKSGAGAPVRDNRGNVITTVFGNFNNASTYRKNSPRDDNRRKVHDPNYIQELRDRYEQFRKQENRNLKFGGGDLATEIKRGQVGFPRRDNDGKLSSHHLGSTDVTRERANVHSLKTDKTHQYHDDLKYAEQQRVREGKLEKLRERQEAKHHGDSQDSVWGRPGGGAPMAQQHQKKANLDQILYAQPTREHDSGTRRSHSEPQNGGGGYKDYHKTSERADYSKANNDQARNGNYVRTTVGSNHANMFEFSHEAKRQRGRDYHLPKPFATEGTEVL